MSLFAAILFYISLKPACTSIFNLYIFDESIFQSYLFSLGFITTVFVSEGPVFIPKAKS